MKPKELTAKDCASAGVHLRKHAIWDANERTIKTDRQHRLIKIDGMWFVYDAVSHH